jgi:hypothetical protein
LRVKKYLYKEQNGGRMAEGYSLIPVAWFHINLIGIYEFYNDNECRNLHALIEKLLGNKKNQFIGYSLVCKRVIGVLREIPYLPAKNSI